MSTVMDTSFDFIINLVAPMVSELSFFLFFALGYLFLRMQLFPRHLKPSKAKKVVSLQSRMHKTIEAEVAGGHMISAVKAWRAMRSDAPAQLETLKLVVKAMLEVERDAVVREITEHMADHRAALFNSETAVAILDAAVCAGEVTVMEEFHKVFYNNFRIRPYYQVHEILIGGYASIGDEKRVAAICSEISAGNMKLTARGHALAIKGFLKQSMLDAALKQILDMHRASFFVPPLAVVQLVRIACEVNRSMEILDACREEIPLPPDASSLLLGQCLKHGDLSRVRQIEQLARQQAGSTPLSAQVYGCLLKNLVLHNDLHALELFQEMQKMNVVISDRLCAVLLSRCAESKFLRFAEEIAQFMRARDGMNLAFYSALMKVYAFSGMYDKACDLYYEILAQGMEPDTVMYGCLMKFAVECGRTDLSRELFSKVETIDVKHYMSLIRAAGRDRDIERAFQVLQKLKESSVQPDLAVYNCVLDACVSAGDLCRARELIATMRTVSQLNIITYNTFLKGVCASGDIHGAKEVLLEMESAGVAPNEVSYNSLINMAVCSGQWQEGWDTVDMMEARGVKVDSYTISIIMKALRRSKDSIHVSRALALFDRSGLEVCSDEVLFSTVLETCIRHRQNRRLEQIVSSFDKSSLQPGVHTFGSLIKACGILQWVDKARELWYRMVDDRALKPNDIALGCMLDALVCNEHVEEALSLFKKCQQEIAPNMIMYCVLIKGFTNTRQASRAMDLWNEMRESKISMTTAAYNGVIDAHARLGLMDKVSFLVQSMEQDHCSPDSITYSTIAKGYCFGGDLDKAFEVYRGMQRNQMVDGSAVHNVLLDGCLRGNRMDLADQLLEDMEKCSIAFNNFTLGILVKMWGRRKQLDKAFQLFEEIPKKHGFVPNAQTKTCLMCACLNNHDLEAALSVFEELRAKEKGADWKTYASMIGGLLRHGQTEKAVGFVKDAYGLNPGTKNSKAVSRGPNLEMECLEQLGRALVQQGQMVSIGLPLLNELRAANVPISGKLLSTFTSPKNSTNTWEQPAH